jgi:hypothetical protein
MRTVNATLLGSITALAILTAPVAAKTTDPKTPDPKTADPQQTDQTSVSSRCVSYQQKPDGTWAALGCQEVGAPVQPQPKPVVHSNAAH